MRGRPSSSFIASAAAASGAAYASTGEEMKVGWNATTPVAARAWAASR